MAEAQTAAAPAAGVADVRLRLLASHDLASPGLDGSVRPRGNNGDVAVLRDTAYVGGGSVSNKARWSAGRICTDWGGVKVVDLADPARPRLRTTITIVDDLGVDAGPVGNPRRGARIDNVSVSAGAVDARTVTTPSFSGDVLAVAVERCEPPYTAGGRIEFYDVNDPGSPKLLGRFTAPRPSGGWGVFEDVRMFTRDNGPGGAARLYAVVTLPFNGSDFRVLDLNDLRDPQEVGAYPSGGDIDRDSVNGCMPAVAARSAAPTPDGTRAIVSLSDGSTSLDPHSGAVLNLGLDDLPRRGRRQPTAVLVGAAAHRVPARRQGGGQRGRRGGPGGPQRPPPRHRVGGRLRPGPHQPHRGGLRLHRLRRSRVRGTGRPQAVRAAGPAAAGAPRLCRARLRGHQPGRRHHPGSRRPAGRRAWRGRIRGGGRRLHGWGAPGPSAVPRRRGGGAGEHLPRHGGRRPRGRLPHHPRRDGPHRRHPGRPVCAGAQPRRQRVPCLVGQYHLDHHGGARRRRPVGDDGASRPGAHHTPRGAAGGRGRIPCRRRLVRLGRRGHR